MMKTFYVTVFAYSEQKFQYWKNFQVCLSFICSLPVTTMVFEILEIKLNKMAFHAYESTLRINVGHTDRTVSSVYNIL